MEHFGLKGNFGFLQQLNLCLLLNSEIFVLLVGGVLSALKSAHRVPGNRRLEKIAWESLLVLASLGAYAETEWRQ